MRKLFITLAVLSALSQSAFCATSIVNNFTMGSGGLIKDDLLINTAITRNFSLGAGGTWTKTDAFESDIYSVNMPLSLSMDFVQAVLRPFYVFEQDGLDGKGAMLHFLINMKQDDVNSVYTQAFMSAAYIQQKAEVTRAATKIEEYKEAAFSLGLRNNFYNTFFFTTDATAHVYPSGISDVSAFRAVTDQNMGANLDIYDSVFGLPKYSVGLKLARGFENKTSIYIGYRFVEMYLTPSVNSFIIGNDFPILKNLWADLGYNHTRDTDGNKGDFVKLSLTYKF